MIPLLSAALMVSAARTLPARPAARVALVARPRGVVHVAVAPLTRTGRSLPPGQRPVCGTRSRRLRALHRQAGGVDLAGRRVCVRCCRTLARRTPSVPGLVEAPRTRDGWVQAFGNLTAANLAAAVRTASTVADVDQVSHLTEVLYGNARIYGARTRHDVEVAALRQLITETRAAVRAATRTPEEVDQLTAAREARNHTSQVIRDTARQTRARDQAQDRERLGHYLMPWERAAIGE